MKLRIVQQPEPLNQMKDEEVELEPQNPEDPSPVPDAAPPVSGKRKRLPKSPIDVFTPLGRLKARKTTASKSKDGNGVLENGGALTSNGDGVVCALGTPAQSKSPTLIRAEEFMLSLGNEHPTFLKVMVRSHVGSCFWMGLPMSFCKKHLPDDDMAVLENENGEEFSMKYIAHKPGLSAGWRKFVAGNTLLEGDVLVFQLTGPCRFKVYVIRANDLNEVDGALGLLILDSQAKQSDAEGTNDAKTKKKRQQKSLPLAIVQTHDEDQLDLQPGQPDEHSGNNSEGLDSEVLECYKFSESTIQFKDVKSFEDFHIVVDGICIDRELPEATRQIYYELCLSKNAFLHSHILPGLNSKLASAVIFEIVTTTEAIKSCKLTTPARDFEVWDQSLRSFEVLGLDVGFLRTRCKRLRDLALDSEAAENTRKYEAAKTGLCEVEDEIYALEERLAELKELKLTCDQELESLKTKAEAAELKFREEANAPW